MALLTNRRVNIPPKYFKGLRRANTEKPRRNNETPNYMKLTMKQEGFVKDLLETKNATEAIRRNYDVKAEGSTARTMAAENLAKPSIQQAITTLKAKFVDDSYSFYEIQKRIALDNERKNPELTNKIANKILDRAGFNVVNKSESKSLNAKFVITRGEEPKDDIVPI
jgi:hypothetical protein